MLYRDEVLSINDFTRRLQSIVGDVNVIYASKISEAERSAILDYADRALNHEFNILGSGWKKIEPLDWKTDFINDFSWADRRFYQNYDLISPQGGRDIKVVWELNRCHHMLWLAETYILTGKKKYAEEIVRQLEDWIEQNPLMYSVNWTCSMDVAIRAVNWIYALSMISALGPVDESFINKVTRSLFEHLFFIISNLEKTIPNSGNHYLSDIVGILFIAPLFPGNRFAKVCYNFALKEFRREALIELNEDGSNYENSISYHRLVTELFAYSLFSLKRRNEFVPEEVAKRICRAADYIKYYTKPGGLAPIIGDNDNGRLLPFVPRDFRDHSYLAEIGGLIFKSKSTCSNGEYIFMGNTPVIPIKEELGIQTSQSGVSVERKGPATLIVTNGDFSLGRCRRQGQTGGTHTHPDNLSFELALGNEDFFIDPGAYVYTSDPQMRNLMRSTTSHSTAVVDNQNLAEFATSSVFMMKQLLSDIKLETLPTPDSTTKIVGQFDFNNGTLRYQHIREYTLTENTLQLSDMITADDETHEVKIYFIVPPGIEVSAKDGAAILLSNGYGLELTAHNSDQRLQPEIESFPVSPSYGVLEEGKRLVFTTKFSNQDNITTSMQWRERK